MGKKKVKPIKRRKEGPPNQGGRSARILTEMPKKPEEERKEHPKKGTGKLTEGGEKAGKKFFRIKRQGWGGKPHGKKNQRKKNKGRCTEGGVRPCLGGADHASKLLIENKAPSGLALKE